MALLCGSAPATADSLKPWAADRFPPLALERLDGAPVDLDALRGRPVVVHFFATWCAPCIEEMASLNAFAGLAGAPAILAVNVGEVDARVRNFFTGRPVIFPILLDRDRAAMKAWKVEGLPTSFVLDRASNPALKTEEPLDWTSPAVAAALATLSQAEPPVQPTKDNGEVSR
ncbi:TlpA disulfide reductase family protein [Bosea thiooxidans]